MASLTRTPPRRNSFRFGPLKIAAAGGGLLALVLVLYVLSALFWGWVFMLIHGAVVHGGMGPGYWTQPWGYWHSIAPWGFLAPFCLG